MATEAVILGHTEEVEYLKELARQRVAQLLAGTDPQEMLDDPNGFVDKVTAAILVLLGPYLRKVADRAQSYAQDLGLGTLDDADIARTIDEAKNRFTDLVVPALVVALGPVNAKIHAALDAGVSAAVIEASLATDATREALLAGFESIAKQAAATLIQTVERSVVDLAAQILSDARIIGDAIINFDWVAVMDGLTCNSVLENSCAPRHGIANSLGGWDGLGRPGAPQLICSLYAKGGSNCRCILEPSDNVGPKLLNPVFVTDAIRAGKERAKHFAAR